MKYAFIINIYNKLLELDTLKTNFINRNFKFRTNNFLHNPYTHIHTMTMFQPYFSVSLTQQTTRVLGFFFLFVV